MSSSKPKNTLRKFLRRGNNLEATKGNTSTIRMNTKAVLLTGGLVVHHEGFLFMKKDGIVNKYKRKFVVLTQGEIRIYDATAAASLHTDDPLGYTRKQDRMRALKRKASCEDELDREDGLEEVIEIGKLKSLQFEKRNSKMFSFTFRTDSQQSHVRNKRLSTKSKAGSVGSRSRISGNPLNNVDQQQQQQRMSRFSRMSRALGSIRKTDSKNGSSTSPKRKSNQSHYSILNPLQWNLTNNNPDKTFLFRCDTGRQADAWVQSLLFELRNQATGIQRSITCQDVSSCAQPQVLDSLHRQHVDLWALAKGKVSLETKIALEMFVRFLESFKKKEDEEVSAVEKSYAEESETWKDMLKTVTYLLDSQELTSRTGLEELQVLNEYVEHETKDVYQRETYTFTPTLKILNPKNDALDPSNQKGFFRGAKFMKTSRPNRKRRSLQLDDIVVLTKEESANKEMSEELDKKFTSAVDVKRDKERKEEQKLMETIARQSQKKIKQMEIENKDL